MRMSVCRVYVLVSVVALGLLAVPGLVFAAITFVVGDYVAPATEREAVLMRSAARAVGERPRQGGRIHDGGKRRLDGHGVEARAM